MSQFSQSFTILHQWWYAANAQLRAAAITVAVVLPVILFMTGRMNAPVAFVPLYQDVKPNTAAEMETILHEHNISMQYSEQEGAVRVPPQDISAAVAVVESAGILTRVRQDAGGIEALDKIGLGTSTELEKKRILIADEGELSRALMRIDKIRSASVTISPGNSTALFGDDVPPSASIMITPRPGETLNAAQVKGVVSYVARAVSGLTTRNITLVDQTGAALWNGPDGATPAMPQTIMETPVTIPQAPVPAPGEAAPVIAPNQPSPPSIGTAIIMPWARGHQLTLWMAACAILILLLLLQRRPKPQSLLVDAVIATPAGIRASAPLTMQSDQNSAMGIGAGHDEPADHPARRWGLADLAYGGPSQNAPRADIRRPFLSGLDAEQIEAVVAGEMPQTIAVIAANLDPDRSAVLLSHFAPDQQVDLSRRIAALTPLPAGVITDIEMSLLRKHHASFGGGLSGEAPRRITEDGGPTIGTGSLRPSEDGLRAVKAVDKIRDHEKLAA